MSQFIKAECYLTIEPEFRRSIGGAKEIRGAKVVKITQTKPTTPPGAPVVHLRLKIPESALRPFVVDLTLPEKALDVIPEIIEPEPDPDKVVPFPTDAYDKGS